MRKLFLFSGTYHLRLRLFWIITLCFVIAIVITSFAANLISNWITTLDQITTTLAFTMFIILSTVFLSTFIFMFFILTRPYIRFLKAMMSGIARMAGGDLDERVPNIRKDELGQLATHINEMAAELQRQRKKERQDEVSRMELITGVSHDLRTPLTSMIGYIQLLNERGYRSEEELDKYIKHTYNQAIRLQQRIDVLFEYTRLTSPDAKVQLQQIFIKKLLQQLLSEFQPLATEHGLRVEENLPRDDFEVNIDPDKIVRALDNLLINALKFSHRPGVIRVKCYRMSHTIIIEIANKGDTLTKEQEERLFDRFYRGESSRRMDDNGLGSGSGLGLAIAKSIAQLHGGDLELVYNNGVYKFKLQLPMRNLHYLNPRDRKLDTSMK